VSSMSTDKTSLQRAGASLIAGSLAFVAVFSYLAATFGYPDVLDHSAAQVLPLLTRGGQRLRIVWFIYGALPLMFVLAGVASGRILERASPGLRTLGVSAAVTAGVAMMAGLLRWPTIEWTLAQHWSAAAGADQVALAAVFDASNLFLGNLVGEFVGEICTAAWFLALGVAWRRQGRRLFGSVGVAAAALMALAALRNITPLVDPISDINNVALPLWLIAMGIAFLRDGRTATPSGSGIPSLAPTVDPQ
jgi:hypothetical protein